MSGPSVEPVASDEALVATLLERIGEDLSMMLGRELDFDGVAVAREATRPAGAGCIHISFKLGVQHDDGRRGHGSLLVPLPEAITWACLLLMIPEESLQSRREETTLDGALKDAMLEIGNMIGGACNNGIAELGLVGWTLHSEGCQGVRSDVRPAFPYEEGSPLVVARMSSRLEDSPPASLVLMLPPLR
jgi:hypothetical protein